MYKAIYIPVYSFIIHTCTCTRHACTRLTVYVYIHLSSTIHTCTCTRHACTRLTVYLYIHLSQTIESSNTNVCLVGLHCCGDLTSTLLHLISSHPHPSLRSAVIVPCCYHKMSTTEEGRIRHFPLSRCVKQLMSSQRFTNLNHYAFRLAAQDSVMRFVCSIVKIHVLNCHV